MYLFTAENAEGAEMTEKERLNRITKSIIGAAIEVHRALGPGLLESAYEACLAFELVERGLKAVKGWFDSPRGACYSSHCHRLRRRPADEEDFNEFY